ncbi:protein lifeguard 1-like isoform X2 [Sitodiplosis mosellana]|uniref:protein lifeguard 1-like isoform X2 n=1 Tax=Sitodiplosis mosellana TaxID=263140 RepID=UPI0024449594|nr:protein lifeguard 1-like isoform X2 [Sitodiplosis mosellana]
MNPQRPYASLPKIAPVMNKNEAVDSQSSHPPEQNHPPLNEETTRPDIAPPNYQSSVVQKNESNFDPENVKGFDFNDDSIRRNFIRKVFSLIATQLVITFVLVFLISQPRGIREYMFRNAWIFHLGLIGLIISMLTIVCSEGIRRTYPSNMICLGVITLCEGICIGYIGAIYEPDVILTALGLTVIVVMGLSWFAVQTKYDFTKKNGALFSALLIFTIAFLIGTITRDDITDVILSGFAVILFSVYLIHDIQLIIGGKHQYQLNPEEYILAALIIYIDILHIFRRLLRILSVLKRK